MNAPRDNTHAPSHGRITAAVIAGLLGLTVIAGLTRDPVAVRPDTGAAVRTLNETAASAVLTELLDRVYSAFGQQEEAAIYDGLATAVAPALLTDLYLQRRKAQEAELQEGGTSVILDVTLDDMQMLERDGPGHRIDATWTVTGEVGHEDHRHERINAYSAVVTLGPEAGTWLLTGFDLNRIRREETPTLFFEDLQ